MELMVGVSPSLFEALDVSFCLKPSRDDKLIIANLTATFKDDCVFIGEELRDSLSLGGGGELAERVTGAADHLELFKARLSRRCTSPSRRKCGWD